MKRQKEILYRICKQLWASYQVEAYIYLGWGLLTSSGKTHWKALGEIYL